MSLQGLGEEEDRRTGSGGTEGGQQTGDGPYKETFALSRYDAVNHNYLPPTPLVQEDDAEDKGLKLNGWYFAPKDTSGTQLDARRRVKSANASNPPLSSSSSGFMAFLTERPRKYGDIAAKGREGIKTGLDSPLHNGRRKSSSSLDPMSRSSAGRAGEDQSWIDDVLRLRGVSINDEDEPDHGQRQGCDRTASVNSYRSTQSSNSRSSFDNVRYRRSFDISGRIETPSPVGGRTPSMGSNRKAAATDPGSNTSSHEVQEKPSLPMAQPQASRPARIARLDSALEVKLSAPGQGT